MFRIWLWLSSIAGIGILLDSCQLPSNKDTGSQIAKNAISNRIILTEWGLKHPTEIGHLVLGQTYHQGREQWIIYDVRRTKLKIAIANPARPDSCPPRLVNKWFVIDRFDGGNINSLNGYFSAFAKAPSHAIANIEAAPGEKRRSLAFSYFRRENNYAGFWVHLFATKASINQRIYLDVRNIPYLSFAIRGEKGGEDLLLKIADSSWEQKEDSLPIGSVNAFLPRGRIDLEWQRAWIPLDRLPPRINRQQLASLVFEVAQPGTGRIFIADLALTDARENVFPAREFPAPAEAKSKPKAMWLWETSRLIHNPTEVSSLIALCRREQITDLFLQLPYRANQINGEWRIQWDEEAFRILLAALHRAKLRVEALDGDPSLALATSHDRVLAAIKSIFHYNQRVKVAERWDGLRYDNEAYLLPQFTRGNKQNILRQYLNLLQKMRKLINSTSLTLGADIPFWFDTRNNWQEPAAELDGRPFSEHIIDLVDNVAIMDYRTQAYGPDGIIAHAWDELEYANRRGKKVFVGVETVDLPDETLIEFGAQGNGACLVLDDYHDQSVRFQLFPSQKCPSNRSRVGSFNQHSWILWTVRQTVIPASKLTFAKYQPPDLNRVLSQAQIEFAHQPSFAGFAIHSYESYRKWIK